MPSNAEPIAPGVRSTTHFVGLDALRGLAALAILGHHFLEQTPWSRLPEHAYLAVDFFFMLSGVVVAHAYEGKLRHGLSFARFVSIRLTRLYPLLFLGVVLGTVMLALRSILTGDIGLRQIAGAASLAFLILPVPRSGGASAFPVNGPMWSLFFELLANFAYALAFVRLGTRALIALTAVLVALYIWTCLALGTVNFGIGWDRTFPLGLLKATAPFLYGVLLYRLDLLSPKTAFPAFPLAVALLLGILAAPVPLGARGVPFDLLAGVVVFPVIIILGSASARRGESRRLWSTLGDLSYPIYVLHQPIILTARQIGYPSGSRPLPYVLWSVPVAVLCVAVAAIAFRYYDAPLRLYLRRRRFGSTEQSGAASTARALKR